MAYPTAAKVRKMDYSEVRKRLEAAENVLASIEELIDRYTLKLGNPRTKPSKLAVDRLVRTCQSRYRWVKIVKMLDADKTRRDGGV